MEFNILRSSENDTYSTSNAKRLVGAAAVVGAVFAGGCEANQSGDGSHYSAGTGNVNSEEVLYGQDCLSHPDIAFSTGSVSSTGMDEQKLSYLLRDTIKVKSGNYSDFSVRLSPEQIEDFAQGLKLVESAQTDQYYSTIDIAVLNPDGWDGLNINRPAGTFEGDICVSDGR